ncbi:hypothetical protein ACWELJ_12155 [Nocardia sp. NPDC004582]
MPVPNRVSLTIPGGANPPEPDDGQHHAQGDAGERSRGRDMLFEAVDPTPPPAAVPPVAMWHRAVPNRPPRPPLLWLVGVHGGAGVSSLAASLRWAGDAGQRWPARIGAGADMDSPLVVLVGRSHLRGVNALHRALLAHQARATPAGSVVVGVLTVADSARPLPVPVARRREEMEGLAIELGARTWRLGWLEPWRALEPYEMAAWDPAAGVSPMEEGDPTRTPPQPVRLLAEQILTAARIAGTRITERAQHGAEPVGP